MTADVDLTRTLPQLQVPEVQRIARRFVPEGRLPVRKDALIAAVAAVLASPARLDGVVGRLTPLELELLREVERRGGAADAWELSTHVALRGFQPASFALRTFPFHRWLNHSGAAAYLTPLVDDGLLVRAGSGSLDRYDEARLGADPRLLARVRQGRPAPPKQLEVPTLAGATTPAAPHPMAVVLEVLDAAHLALDLGGVPVTRAGTLARPFVRRAERERPLRAGRMEALLLTLFALGLLRRPADTGAGGRGHPWTVDRDQLAALMRLPPYFAYATVVDATCLVGDGRVDDRWNGGLYGTAPARALRRAVFDALPALPPHPVALESAATALWGDALVHVFGWADRPGASAEFGRQQPSEVAAILAGPGVRLGLLATSATPAAVGEPRAAPPTEAVAPGLGARWYAAARARRLRPMDAQEDAIELGAKATEAASAGVRAVAVGSGDADAAGRAAPLVVQPNFEVLAYLDRLDADAVAALVCATATRIDVQTATFEIDRRSVNRALDLGRDVEGVIADLRAHAGTLPANVERAVRDWAGRRDRLRVTLDARLVEYADASARDAALERLAGARPVGDRFALLAPGASAPTGEGNRYRDAPERRITIDRAGDLRITGPLDLAGRAVVHALTREGPRGRRVFDPDAIRAGPLPGGWRDVLRARLATAAPAHVDALLRAWSGDEPPPALHGAVLFRHPRASTWAQNPHLAPHLTAALSDGTYLVAADAVEPLTAALRELGFAVDGPSGPVPTNALAPAEGAAPAATEAVDRLVAGLSTRRVRERLEEAIAARQVVELRYASERERYGRYGRTLRSRGRVRTGRFEPLLVRYRGSLPYLHARPVDGGDDDEELIRIGYVEAIAVLA